MAQDIFDIVGASKSKESSHDIFDVISTPAPPPKKSPYIPVLSELNQAVAGGLETLFGLPGDVMNAGIQLATAPFGGTSYRVGGSPEMRQISRETFETAEPEGAVQKFSREYAGPFAAGTAAQMVGLGIAGQAMPTGGALASGVARSLPAAVGAKAGGMVAETVAPDNPLVRFIAENLGALTPAGIESLTRKAVRAFPSIREDTLKAEIGRELQQKLGPEFEQRLHASQDIGQTIQSRQPPGSPYEFRPTTAGVAGTPEAIQLERGVLRGQEGMANEFDLRRASGVQAGRESMADVMGAPEGTTQGVPEVKRAITTRQDMTADARARKAIKAKMGIEQSTNDLDVVLDQRRSGRMTDVEAGENLYGIYRERLGKAKEQASQAYNDAAIPGEIVGNSTPSIDAAKAQIKRMQGSVTTENFPTEALDRLTGGQVLTGVDDLMHLEAVRSDLSSMKRSAAVRQNPKLSANINELIRAIDSNQGSMADAAGKLESYNRLVRAREQYLGEVVEPFRQGQIGKTMKPGRAGEAPAAEKASIPKKLTTSEETYAQFEKAMGDDPGARTSMADYLMNDLQESTTNKRTGAFDQGKFRAWENDHTDIIERLPELRDRLSKVELAGSDLGRAQTFAERTERAGKATVKSQEHSALTKFLGAEAEREIATVMRSGNPSEGLRQLKRTIESPRVLRDPKERAAAMTGLKRELRDWMEQKTEGSKSTTMGDEEIHLAKSTQMKRLLDDYEPALKQIYGDAAIKSLRQIHKGIEMMQRSDRIPLSGPGTAADLKTMGVLNTLFSKGAMMGIGGRGIAVGLGYATGGTQYVLAGLGAEGAVRLLGKWSQAKRTALLSEAMMNPDVAKKLIDFSKAQPGPAKVIAKQLERMIAVEPSMASE